ncbi:MAG: hypothetical protein ACI35O_11540, partial [Bacillaceae bacterium]
MGYNEHDIDDLFDMNESQQLIKKAKRNSLKRMILTNIIITVCTIVLLTIIKLQLTPYLLTKEIVREQSYYDIYGANTFVGPWHEQVKLIGSKAEAPVYKLVNGIPVPLKTIYNKQNEQDIFIDKGVDKYRYNGQKLVSFKHPKVTYKHYS